MQRTVYTHTYASVAALLLVFATSIVAAPAFAQPAEMQDIHIRITDNGIVQTGQQLQGGLYRVTVTNETRGHRGIVMKGIDRAVSPYTRFTKVLAPGHNVTFRWFFPTDRQVVVRDLVRCRQAERTCMNPLTGGLMGSLQFV